jgi:PIG-X / PBN1
MHTHTHTHTHPHTHIRINTHLLHVHAVAGRSVPSFLDLSRETHNEGYHRELVYAVRPRYEQVRTALTANGGVSYSEAGTIKEYRCGTIFFESFSESVYVDRYQLEDLYRRGQGPYAYHSRELDLEVAANHFAARANVVALVLLSGPLTYPQAPAWNVTVPLHLRYQPPTHKYSHFHVGVENTRTVV